MNKAKMSTEDNQAQISCESLRNDAVYNIKRGIANGDKSKVGKVMTFDQRTILKSIRIHNPMQDEKWKKT